MVLNVRVGSLDDSLRRAVVLLEFVDLGRGVVPLEREYGLNLCTSEGVDALGIVTHDADIGVLQRQAAHDDKLRHVGVLILVNQEVLELILVLLQHIGGIALEDVGLQE